MRALLRDKVEEQKSKYRTFDEQYFAARAADIEKEDHLQDKEVLATYGMLEGTDARVGPMRRVIAVKAQTSQSPPAAPSMPTYHRGVQKVDRYSVR